jgi:hypothetical protein
LQIYSPLVTFCFLQVYELPEENQAAGWQRACLVFGKHSATGKTATVRSL